jgi:hypothetical protein
MNYGVKFTPELEATILAVIRSGGFVQDAFRVAGVPDRTWQRWMNPSHTRGIFARLQTKIKQAEAVARVTAAQKVKADDPFKWSANGPGRDRPGEPGWAAMVPPAEPPSADKLDPAQFPEFVRFLNAVRIVMAVYPDARKMLDELLANEPAPALGPPPVS